MKKKEKKVEFIKKNYELVAEVFPNVFHDEVTGLLNKDSFLMQASDLLNKNKLKKYGILAFNIYNFRTANVLYGEQKCNNLLKHVAERLKELFKDEPFICCYGGDQFVVLFEYSNKKIRNFVHYPQRILNSSAPIPNQKIKMGVYAPIDTSNRLVVNCARAFKAINNIKDRYDVDYAYFDDELIQKEKKQTLLEGSMEKSLKNGDFKVYYQPKHVAKNGNLAGAEALVRWDLPGAGMISPDDFIPLFEKNGFIKELDLYVLEKVCEDLVSWKAKGLDIVPISVNFSRQDYSDDQILDKQIQIVNASGIERKYIHFEVTESKCGVDIESLIKKLKKTQQADFKIEMDDFGTGYSSLGALHKFPLDVIKLDKSLIDAVVENDIIVAGMINIAHNLGLNVVAEGVENPEQLNILKSATCDIIQGYHFSKPLKEQDFENYLGMYKNKTEEIPSRKEMISSDSLQDPQPL
ncbi:GGDEF domain-containing phosphodiesterase [Treponema sp.]|uniref:putative bifunctional diguanylate cyclase/phosphodiesterase n=1 Tax=Treponema sp. TaxID=166 RepID=UPI00298E5DDA|nr:GGDEF domain-containing phosphodiesterase [Treponema sp.]MCQ2241676.1 GGDEF domain-containing phosphodiesterase [Treponema sp.]